MPDLTRDAVIETADAAITGAYHHTADWQTPAAAGAVDAVLTALADDTERYARETERAGDPETANGLLESAYRIRCLLPSTEGDQP